MRRMLPAAVLAGVVIAVVTAVVGQLDADPDLDPVRLTLGEYAALDPDRSVEGALAVLGLAALALPAALRGAGAPVQGWPERLLLAWGGGLAPVTLLPTVVAGKAWTGHLSVAALGALPVAAGLLAPRLAAAGPWRGAARPLEWLALAGGLGLAALTYVALPGDRVMIGLVERALLGVEAGTIALLAAWAVRLTRPVPVPSGPHFAQ